MARFAPDAEFAGDVGADHEARPQLGKPCVKTPSCAGIALSYKRPTDDGTGSYSWPVKYAERPPDNSTRSSWVRHPWPLRTVDPV